MSELAARARKAPRATFSAHDLGPRTARAGDDRRPAAPPRPHPAAQGRVRDLRPRARRAHLRRAGRPRQPLGAPARRRTASVAATSSRWWPATGSRWSPPTTARSSSARRSPWSTRCSGRTRRRGSSRTPSRRSCSPIRRSPRSSTRRAAARPRPRRRAGRAARHRAGRRGRRERRRDARLHLGHHRDAQGRADHPPQLPDLHGARVEPGPRRSGPDDTWLFVMPFHTIAGLGSMTTLTLLGATLVLPATADPAATLPILARERVTVLAQTPTFYLALAAQPGFGPEAVGAVRRCMTYGGQVAPAAIEAWSAARAGRAVGHLLGAVRAVAAGHRRLVRPLDGHPRRRRPVVDRQAGEPPGGARRRRGRRRRRAGRADLPLAVGDARLPPRPRAHGGRPRLGVAAHRRHRARRRRGQPVLPRPAHRRDQDGRHERVVAGGGAGAARPSRGAARRGGRPPRPVLVRGRHRVRHPAARGRSPTPTP